MICLENNYTNNNEDIASFATQLFSTLNKIPSHIKDVCHKNNGYQKVSMYWDLSLYITSDFNN